MEDTKILELLKNLEESNKWVSENYDNLRKKFEGKVLAIKNKEVVHEAETVESLLDELKKRGEDPAFLLMETIPSRDVSFIL
ncbi:MAG: hypothetical protein J7J17_01560 [Hadesarchaea archaeon]|nr:hypothetical protein [Hadesarchaea archaeon]